MATQYHADTEIDWIAYMQEVQGYKDGERDYTKLKGDTGPLVYPAGFVYLFSFLQTITGGAIPSAQLVFAGLYIVHQFFVMALYIRAKSLPPWSLVLLCISRRIHSIFVLRLFNDCWAMLVAYVATFALQSRKWTLSIFLYSLAVSIKMNVLLFAPGVLAVILKEGNLMDTVKGIVAGIVLQLLLGAPFILSYPMSYLQRAFEFTRVFMFKWSVNLQFLPENIFLSKQLAILLLVLHLRMLWSFAKYRWFMQEGGVYPAVLSFFSPSDNSKKKAKTAVVQRFNNDTLLQIVFMSNFIGIVCARSLHYQFYSWYFHTLPFLVLRTQLPKIVSACILLIIEIVWNMYPPSATASLCLLGAHACILCAFWAYPAPYPIETRVIGVRPAAKR